MDVEEKKDIFDKLMHLPVLWRAHIFSEHCVVCMAG